MHLALLKITTALPNMQLLFRILAGGNCCAVPDGPGIQGDSQAKLPANALEMTIPSAMLTFCKILPGTRRACSHPHPDQSEAPVATPDVARESCHRLVADVGPKWSFHPSKVLWHRLYHHSHHCYPCGPPYGAICHAPSLYPTQSRVKSTCGDGSQV